MSLYFVMTKSWDIHQLQALAARQAGLVTWAQLRHLGLSDATIAGWVRTGRLIPTPLRGVYALGYLPTSQEARLWSAVLFAGPGAMLSHLSAAQHRGLIKYAPQTIHVSTPRKVASPRARELRVHPRRTHLSRSVHCGIPVTTDAQTLLDLATVRPDLLPRALGQLDFQNAFSAEQLLRAARSGHPGGPGLAAALDRYDPSLARLNDELEFDFYAQCVTWKIEPLPIPNVEVTPGLTIDALWPDHGVGVELDGRDNHHSDAQLLRDAERELICRRLGLVIIRYRRAQILRTPDDVHADLCAALALRAPGQPEG